MAGRRIVRPAQIGHGVLNARIEFERRNRILRSPQRIRVVRVHGGGVKKQLGIHRAVPAQGRGPVAPAEVKEILGSELVAAEVHAGKHPVLLAQLRVHLGVHVVEVNRGVLQLEVARKRQKQIKIGPTAAQHKARLALHERTLDGQAAAQQADSALGGKALAVALLLAHVQHAREAATVVRRHSALVQRDVAYRVRVENAKESEQVRRRVHGGLVQQNQVLVGIATAHVESARRLAHGADARQKGEGAHDVGFAQQLRNLFDLLARQRTHRHLGRFHVVVKLLALHRHFAQLKRLLIQANRELHVLAARLYGLLVGRIAEQLCGYASAFDRNRYAKHSVGVGDDAGFFGGGFPAHHHPWERFAVGGIDHRTADYTRLRGKGERKPQEHENNSIHCLVERGLGSAAHLGQTLCRGKGSATMSDTAKFRHDAGPAARIVYFRAHARHSAHSIYETQLEIHDPRPHFSGRGGLRIPLRTVRQYRKRVACDAPCGRSPAGRALPATRYRRLV